MPPVRRPLASVRPWVLSPPILRTGPGLQVIEDLVRGELMQLGLAKEPEARFQEYILKSEAKTASLLARSCHSVAVLAGGDQNTETCAREYGRHLGIAFQLIDDVLDVVQSSAAMGKETSVDLKLGLATAPVLFASEQVGSITVP